MNIVSAIRVVGARAGHILRRAGSAAETVEAKLSKAAAAADNRTAIRKGGALKEEKAVVHVQGASAGHGHIAVRGHVGALHEGCARVNRHPAKGTGARGGATYGFKRRSY